MNENRLAPRAKANIPIAIKYNNVECYITSDNISDSGVFIVSGGAEIFPKVGSIIDIEILGIMGTPTVSSRAKVIRITQDGCGLQFQDNPFATEI